MNRGYFQVRSKQKKEKNLRLKSIAVLVIALVIFYCLLSPLKFGKIGTIFKGQLSEFLGKGMFMIPIFMVLYSISLSRNINVTLIHQGLSLIFIISISVFLSAVSKTPNYGGILGKFLKTEFFERLFGPSGTIIVLILGIFYLCTVLFRISLSNLFMKLKELIVKDWKEWNETRNLIRKIENKHIPIKARIQQQETPETIPSLEPAFAEKLEKKETSPSKEEIKPKIREERVKEERLVKEEKPEKLNYQLPDINLLSDTAKIGEEISKEAILTRAALLERTLINFGVQAKVVDVSTGPVITRFDLTLEPGVKIQQITGLNDDIALAMKTANVRIIAPVPGKGTVGIEIPNPKTKFVGLREIMESEEFSKSESKLTIALGQTTDGKPYVTDLIPMPHLLIAGATGTGKSVCIHTIIMSILYKAKPDEIKFLLIDPKRLELPIYNGIPHLYDPKTSPSNVKVVTTPKEAGESLKYLVKVMEKRYEKFAQATVRNIDGYNELMLKKNGKKEFYIIVIIDELADLMLTLPKEIEDSVQRLAQMARAVGIHLVLATQRPSVDVITGVIKANLSSRIALQVLSKTDSRVILDTMGAEDLLGRGDMLFLPTGEPKPIRLQGAYVSEKNIERVINAIKGQKFIPEYDDLAVIKKEEISEKDLKLSSDLNEALKLIIERRRISQDLLKARFGSSAKASDILSVLEMRGFIYKPEGTNKWQIFFDKVEKYLEGNQNLVSDEVVGGRSNEQ